MSVQHAALCMIMPHLTRAALVLQAAVCLLAALHDSRLFMMHLDSVWTDPGDYLRAYTSLNHRAQLISLLSSWNLSVSDCHHLVCPGGIGSTAVLAFCPQGLYMTLHTGRL